ncbi:MAG: hypothetical protein ACWGPS_05165 [Candidatus Promineifilaceae bacterium]
MSSVVAYSQIVNAVVQREAWDEAYFSLLSLKAHLQSLPGWQRFDLWAQDMEDGNVKLIAVTNWDYPDQLKVWLSQEATVDGILRSIEPPPISLEVDLFEEVA